MSVKIIIYDIFGLSGMLTRSIARDLFKHIKLKGKNADIIIIDFKKLEFASRSFCNELINLKKAKVLILKFYSSSIYIHIPFTILLYFLLNYFSFPKRYLEIILSYSNL